MMPYDMKITFTGDDVQMVEKFIEIKNKGYYADGKQVTEVYNRVLHKNLNVTNCGSCIRLRINELENALKWYKNSQNKATGGDKAPTDDKITPQNAKNAIKRKALSPKKK